ncbi:MAG TPA: SDR family oxidoreductase [Phycisphaerae bacterium]|nr:SDR family oxidoreductase [Phycisphaerae bacterium]HRW53011.1 SDR family oxidoreductase [Phycisphaerae bacterium]
MQTPIVNLKGRTAIVTGGGRGIGRAVAKRFACAGANVVVASRTLDDLHDTRKMIERDGGGVLVVPVDVSEVAGVEQLISETISAFGQIDVLVNNAGTAPLATIDEMEPNLFDKIVRTNVRTVYLCSRGVWPHMVEHGEGVIINTASLAAYDAFPGFAAYGAAKAFVVAYTKFLAKEGADLGIRVYGVSPGAVETDMLRGAFPDFPSAMTLEPDDVAVMFETLLSPAYRHSSGQTVIVSRTL